MDDETTRTIPAIQLAPQTTRFVEVISPGRPSPFRAREGVVRLGRDASNEVVIDDPFVSRVHLEIRVFPHSVEVVDLDTKNGTWFQGARIRELPVRDAVSLVLGRQVNVSIRVGDDAPFADVTSPAMVAPPLAPPPPVQPRARAGEAELLGDSAAMQKLRAAVGRVAPSPMTVLIEGETGTGKEVVARALHAWSPRAPRSLVVFDCAAVSPNLIASELFGHVKGAFTGAVSNAEGAFRKADGGTLFLDEVGELPLDLQPALLRALEARQVKPVGGDAYRAVDVRVIAATNRSLEAEVEAGRFRRDLLFRLAVGRIRVPALSARRDDVAMLARHFAGALGATLTPAVIAALTARAWPGNVRELRNVVERAVLMAGGAGAVVASLDDDESAFGERPTAEPTLRPPPPDLPFQDAKQVVVDQFEREYLMRLFEQSEFNLSEAARRSGVDRRYLRELYRKHGIDLDTLRGKGK